MALTGYYTPTTSKQLTLSDTIIENFKAHGVELYANRTASGFFLKGTYKPVLGFTETLTITSSFWSIKDHTPRPFKDLVNELFDLLQITTPIIKDGKPAILSNKSLSIDWSKCSLPFLKWLSTNIKHTKRGLRWLRAIQDMLWLAWGWTKQATPKPVRRSKRSGRLAAGRPEPQIHAVDNDAGMRGIPRPARQNFGFLDDDDEN